MLGGTVLLPAAGIDAPVTAGGVDPAYPWLPPTPAGPLEGPRYLAQLAVNGVVVGTPQPFRTGAFAGYVAATEVTVPGVAAGASVTVTMLAWDTFLGATYAEAANRGWGGFGTSANLSVQIPAGGSVPLTGLQPFNLAILIPEPSAGALALLGAAALGLRGHRGVVACRRPGHGAYS
jgi:hypothetical protein